MSTPSEIWHQEFDNVFSFIPKDLDIIQNSSIIRYPRSLIGIDYWDRLENYDDLGKHVYKYHQEYLEQFFPIDLVRLIMPYIYYPVIRGVDIWGRIGLVLSLEWVDKNESKNEDRNKNKNNENKNNEKNGTCCFCIFQRYTRGSKLCYGASWTNNRFYGNPLVDREDCQNLVKLLQGEKYMFGNIELKLNY